MSRHFSGQLCQAWSEGHNWHGKYHISHMIPVALPQHRAGAGLTSPWSYLGRYYLLIELPLRKNKEDKYIHYCLWEISGIKTWDLSPFLTMYISTKSKKRTPCMKQKLEMVQVTVQIFYINCKNFWKSTQPNVHSTFDRYTLLGQGC